MKRNATKRYLLALLALGAGFLWAGAPALADTSLTQNMRQRGTTNPPAQVVLLQRALLELETQGQLNFFHDDFPIYATNAQADAARTTLREAIAAGNGLFGGVTAEWLKAFQVANLDAIRSVTLTHPDAKGKICEGYFGALADAQIATGMLGNCTRDYINTLLPSLNLGGGGNQQFSASASTGSGDSTAREATTVKPKYDLAIESIEAPEKIGQGETAEIKVTIVNNGTEPIGTGNGPFPGSLAYTDDVHWGNGVGLGYARVYGDDSTFTFLPKITDSSGKYTLYFSSGDRIPARMRPGEKKTLAISVRSDYVLDEFRRNSLTPGAARFEVSVTPIIGAFRTYTSINRYGTPQNLSLKYIADEVITNNKKEVNIEFVVPTPPPVLVKPTDPKLTYLGIDRDGEKNGGYAVKKFTYEITALDIDSIPKIHSSTVLLLPKLSSNNEATKNLGVTVENDYLLADKYEESNTNYRQLVTWSLDMQTQGCRMANPEQKVALFESGKPMVCNSILDATMYLSRIGKRLPSESEFLAAATAGKYVPFPWGNDAPMQEEENSRANFGAAKGVNGQGDGANVTEHVERRTRGASQYGLLNMSGNVAEWTEGRNSEGAHWTRGGSWQALAFTLRNTLDGRLPNDRNDDRVGFRGYRSLTQSEYDTLNAATTVGQSFYLKAGEAIAAESTVVTVPETTTPTPPATSTPNTTTTTPTTPTPVSYDARFDLNDDKVLDDKDKKILEDHLIGIKDCVTSKCDIIPDDKVQANDLQMLYNKLNGRPIDESRLRPRTTNGLLAQNQSAIHSATVGAPGTITTTVGVNKTINVPFSLAGIGKKDYTKLSYHIYSFNRGNGSNPVVPAELLRQDGARSATGDNIVISPSKQDGTNLPVGTYMIRWDIVREGVPVGDPEGSFWYALSKQYPVTTTDGISNAQSMLEVTEPAPAPSPATTTPPISPQPTPSIDPQRKADLETLAAALEKYHEANGTYKLSAAHSNNGQGWVSHEDGNAYKKSIVRALVEAGSLSAGNATLKDPKSVKGDPGYMLYICNRDANGNMVGTPDAQGKYHIFALTATLEQASDSEKQTAAASCNGSGGNGTVTRYGKNYSLSGEKTPVAPPATPPMTPPQQTPTIPPPTVPPATPDTTPVAPPPAPTITYKDCSGTALTGNHDTSPLVNGAGVSDPRFMCFDGEVYGTRRYGGIDAAHEVKPCTQKGSWWSDNEPNRSFTKTKPASCGSSAQAKSSQLANTLEALRKTLEQMLKGY